MPTSRIKYVNQFIDRHGKERLQYRAPGQAKKTLRPPLGSPEFWEDYLAASTGAEIKPATPTRKHTRTMAWIIARYKTSAHWKGLSDRTRYVRGRQYGRFCEKFGAFPLEELDQRHLYQIQDAGAETPHETNNVMKALTPVFDYAVRQGHIKQNPRHGMKRLKGRNPDGFRAWTDAEMQQFEAYWVRGTKERLAYELYRHTGQRRSDVYKLGKQHETKDGWLKFTQFKGRDSKPQPMEIPIFDELRTILDASPTGDMTYLVTEFGEPFKSGNSFATWFAKAVKRAGLSGISGHGLRKTFAATQAEEASTTNEIAALGGWSDLQQVELYTKSARRKMMAKNVQARRKKRQT